MALRKRLNRKKSNKNFKRGMKIQKKNIKPRSTRGGYRL